MQSTYITTNVKISFKHHNVHAISLCYETDVWSWSSIFTLFSHLGPDNDIPTAPIGAVMRITKTAIVKISIPTCSSFLPPSFLALSRGIEPIAA